MYKRYIVLLAQLLIITAVFGEEAPKRKKMSYSLDLVSKHMWRGSSSGTAPCIEPTINYHPTSDFTLSGWAAFSINESYTEVDLYASYQIKRLNITLFDYYCPKPGVYSGKDMINYKSRETKHLIESQVTYQPFETLPLHVSAATMLYGDDLDANGNQQYSSYFETKYNLSIQKTSFDVFMGFTNGNSFYDEDFNIVNLGVTASRVLFSNRRIRIPIKTSLIGNPAKKNIHFSVKISIS